MLRRPAIVAVSLALVAGACASGPSAATVEADRRPTTTTTTEPPPEGVFVVAIRNAAFRPANLQLDLDEFWIVECRNEDEREYVVEARRGEFMSPTLAQGDVYQVDLREFEPSLIRFFTFAGNQRIPGIIDTRPEQ